MRAKIVRLVETLRTCSPVGVLISRKSCFDGDEDLSKVRASSEARPSISSVRYCVGFNLGLKGDKSEDGTGS